MMNKNVALVVGCNGVSGFNLVRHLLKDPRFEKVYGVSRSNRNEISVMNDKKEAAVNSRFQHVQVDIHNEQDCNKHLVSPLSNTTHLFYVAWTPKSTELEQQEYNFTMFKNVIDRTLGTPLKHIVLVTGTKYYGCHLHAFKVPACETDGRHEGPNFYFKQEDYLKEMKGKNCCWTFSILRPSTIIGYARGNPMNLGTSIAVYASLQREMKQMFLYPGKKYTFENITQDATDVNLLCKMAIWSCFEDSAKDEVFNCVNGDTYQMKDMWAKIATYFGFKEQQIDVANFEESTDFANYILKHENQWGLMTAKYGLRENKLSEIGTWNFVQKVCSRGWDMYSDMSKARKHGFHEQISTQQMFQDLFQQLITEKVIPDPSKQ